MPHVTIEGPVLIADLESKFEPIQFREGTRIIKIGKFFREKTEGSALLEAIIVEAGHQQRFFILLSQKPEGITIRLEPLTDPEKTGAVRIALALVARRVLDWAPGCRYGFTNLTEYLIR
ncbi:MAG: hypothetical protein O6947_05400 [Acidobacteria bacterium]|nr:hypothetical protein [Acidobacteriota bacterium]